ncbi:MAG: hypothetical protein F6K56_14355, partial [Moorea sp. SIO3G5]|nr:hypothetical protein [Moorena sp. SIO3G5]
MFRVPDRIHKSVSIQRSAVSGQPSAKGSRCANSRQLCGTGHKRCDFTQIKPMVTCCLDAVAHGGNHGSRSWGEPPRPRCLPKTALHR